MPERVRFGGLALIFIALGVPLACRRVPPNRWYGLRIPARCADPNVWCEAHARAGRDLLALGAALAGPVLLVPALTRLSRDLRVGVYTAVSALGPVASLGRTWRYANRLRRDRPAEGGGPARSA